MTSYIELNCEMTILFLNYDQIYNVCTKIDHHHEQV